MNELELYNSTVGVIVPRETVINSCYVSTPKQLFMTLMAGERPVFKEYNTAAKYYLRAVEIFRDIYIPCMSDFEYVLALNNYIVKNIQYDYSVLDKERYTAEDIESFEIDAPLFKGKGVCSAKSKFFCLMCCLANIRSILVTGSLKNSERDVRHAWNKVFLQKPNDDVARWWNIDVTNNATHRRNEFLPRMDYFLVSDRQIQKTHTFIDYPNSSEYKQINFLAVGGYEYPRANGG